MIASSGDGDETDKRVPTGFEGRDENVDDKEDDDEGSKRARATSANEMKGGRRGAGR